jgi:ATP/maltotriose-dependent transcriptional regulator MalT
VTHQLAQHLRRDRDSRLNTIKTHPQRICRKLGVIRWYDAVERSKQAL